MRYALTWTDARIRACRDVTGDVRLFEIEPLVCVVQGYRPGAHINVGVMIGGRPDRRSYSLVGLPDTGAYRIAVKRAPESRGGSAYLWSLAAGARLRISDPQSLFELDYGLPHYWLVAGGIGITPIIGMARALARRGADFRLAYCGRDEAAMPFIDELHGEMGERLSLHQSARGRRLDLAAAIAALPSDAGLFLCGPLRMLDGARAAWAQAGRDPTKLCYETFGSSGRHAPEPFWVEIPRQGLRVEVGCDQTMLDALQAAGIDMISDCRRGECGLCLVDVLGVDGYVDHRDVFFSDEERRHGDRICACVSRVVKGGMVIDTAYRPD
jgi:ferredoxin-NADP reductase